MAKRKQFDVIVVGGGLVGSAFAAALASTSLEIALIEPRVPAFPPPAEGDWDARVYALSPASAKFMQTLGMWDELDATRLTPVRRMQIYGDEHGSMRPASINFDAMATGVPELAWIVESGALHCRLWRGLERQKNLTLLCPARCEMLELDVEKEGGRVNLSLAGGVRLEADLVVGADGAHSWLRQAAGLVARDRPYHQVGVVANFATTREHTGTAYQWFRPEGTLAYLPLPGKRISIVWAAAVDYANELLALPSAQLSARVAEAGGYALGDLTMLTAAQGFPLRLLTVTQTVTSGLALIGDAAMVVHPLAGQGVNLGFADAQALAGTLASRELYRGCGDHRLLRRYERGRREDRFALECVTDGLQRLFGSENSALRKIRNRGLELADALPVIKNLLARRAFGHA